MLRRAILFGHGPGVAFGSARRPTDPARTRNARNRGGPPRDQPGGLRRDGRLGAFFRRSAPRQFRRFPPDAVSSILHRPSGAGARGPTRDATTCEATTAAMGARPHGREPRGAAPHAGRPVAGLAGGRAHPRAALGPHPGHQRHTAGASVSPHRGRPAAAGADAPGGRPATRAGRPRPAPRRAGRPPSRLHRLRLGLPRRRARGVPVPAVDRLGHREPRVPRALEPLARSGGAGRPRPAVGDGRQPRDARGRPAGPRPGGSHGRSDQYARERAGGAVRRERLFPGRPALRARRVGPDDASGGSVSPGPGDRDGRPARSAPARRRSWARRSPSCRTRRRCSSKKRT